MAKIAPPHPKAPNGRPLKLTTTITVYDADKRPVRKKVADAICDEMRATGLSAGVAGSAVTGIWGDVINRWLREGRALQVKLDKDRLHYPNHHERVMLDFLASTQQAHAQWIAARNALHASVASGDLVLGEVVEEVDPTQMVEDPETGEMHPRVIKQTVRRKRSLPDARAIEWELEHLALDTDGKRLFASRFELTGADGGPVETESHEDRARRLLDEISAFKQGAADAADLAAEREGRPAS